MALATQCPHCHTTFRVANDQLKLRAGLVRCGACKEIFNGIEHLLGPAAAPPTPQTSGTHESAIPDAAAHAPDGAEAEASRAAALSAALDFVVGVEQPLAGQGATEEQNELSAPDEPNQPMAAPEPPTQPEPPSLPLADPEPPAEPVEPHIEEPGFVTRDRRRQTVGRVLRISMAAGSFVLLLGLLAQGAYSFRNQIAARLPQAEPMLARACATLGCKIRLPEQIDTLAIESSELQAVAGNQDTFALTLLLRNDSGTGQAWPNIELTLTDAGDKALARRILTPRDYLAPAQDAAKGFASRSEQPVKLFFELSQLKASGYHVGLFYP